jgi:hypothetical protein
MNNEEMRCSTVGWVISNFSKDLGQVDQLQNLTALDPKYEDTMIVRNVGSYTREDTSSYPKRLASLAVPPW